MSTFGSGSVKHPSGYSACIGLSASLPPPSGVLFGVLESRLLGLVSWVGLERRSARRGTQCLSLLRLSNLRPESKRDYPPNLSILISGGKENNSDSLSNGE